MWYRGGMTAHAKYAAGMLDPAVAPRLSRAGLAGARALTDAFVRHETISHDRLTAAMEYASDVQIGTICGMLRTWEKAGFLTRDGRYLGPVQGDTRTYALAPGSPLDLREQP